ncbi:hypothetical protein [Oceanivirga salmonicida]|nr:hypothetical protein [Oceanivirga salmonicida]
MIRPFTDKEIEEDELIDLLTVKKITDYVENKVKKRSYKLCF